jgi:RNA polymerase sigma-70 factor (ECF subfamily)
MNAAAAQPLAGAPVTDATTRHPTRGDTDSVLAVRAAAGDREAFAELYGRFHAPLYRYCALRLRWDVEDAVAETFVRAWEALPRYKDTGAPLLAWFYGIARHVVADALRARARTESRPQFEERIDSFDPGQHLDLMREIGHLPAEQRRVIEMKYLLGLRNPEVARALGKSVGAVNALQWRALAALNRRLGT